MASAPSLAAPTSAPPALETGCDILLINLDRSTDRLAWQQRQFDRLGLSFRRIPAVDGRGLAPDLYRRHAFLWERPLEPSEVGCLLSHQAAWRAVAAGSRNALVLEDDAVLSPDLPAFLARCAPLKGAVALNLETRGGQRYLSRRQVRTESADLSMPELTVGPNGATAYLLTPSAARALLADAERRGPIADIYIWTHPRLLKLQVEPALAVPLDHVARVAGRRTPAAARPTIDRPVLGHARSALQVFRHPVLRLRRVAGQATLGLRKLRIAAKTLRRPVETAPSLLSLFDELEPPSDGAKTVGSPEGGSSGSSSGPST